MADDNGSEVLISEGHEYHQFDDLSGKTDNADDGAGKGGNDEDFETKSLRSERSDSNTSRDSIGLERVPNGMQWWSAAFIMVATLIGIGVLGISESLAAMGWGFGMTVMVVLACGCTYAGFIISKIMIYVEKLKIYGKPRKYQVLGLAAFGTRGEKFIQRCQMFYLAGVCVSFQKVAAACFHQVVVMLGGKFCLVSSQLVIALAMLPIMQIQTLAGVTYIATFGVVMIIATVSIYLDQVGQDYFESPDNNGPATFGHSIDAIMIVAFAYQGQSIFPEIQSEMKKPRDFPKAVAAASFTMTVIYVMVGSIGYAFVGRDVPFLYNWDIMHNAHEIRTTVANFFLVLHIITGYMINANVLNQAAVEWVSGGRRTPAGNYSRGTWLMVTSVSAACFFTLANIIPKVSNIITLIGATCGNVLTFLAPIIMLLKLMGDEMSKEMKWLHYIMLSFWSILTVIGTYTAARTLILSLASSRPPFDCGEG
eukprot:m.30072 g.30072  ORF g.30072 m.30072 type:complete len:480 (+) comp16208_c0_seq1:110-1549(+)